MSEIREREVKSGSGIPILLILLAIAPVVALGLVRYLLTGPGTAGIVSAMLLASLAFTVWVLALCGLYKVEPNQSAVLSLFGKYVGTVRTPGLRFNNPFFTKKKVSLRVRNFESGKLKVNELEGSPIEIAAIVVWEVNDSAEAVFNVDRYEDFVQSSRKPQSGQWRRSILMINMKTERFLCAQIRSKFRTGYDKKSKSACPKRVSM